MSKNILIIAAHPDDEVLGCGATMARHTHHGDNVGVVFVSDGVGARNSDFENNLKKRKESALKALKILGADCLSFLDFPDNRLDTIPFLDIVQPLEDIINAFNPSIVYTHHYGDLNIDHAIVHRAIMTACRPLPHTPIEEIYSYEVVSSTEWGLQGAYFQPNRFVDVSDFFSKKIEAIQAYHEEMRLFPHSRSIEHIDALAVHRGATVGLKKAEAFFLVRAIHGR